MTFTPPILEGRHVRLEPLTVDHLGPLCEVGLDPELWRWTVSQVATPDDMRRYIDEALAAERTGTAHPYVTLDRGSGRVIGSTRFGSLDPPHRRAEIGWTWLGRAWQGTAANTEAKYLMLRHAFETMGCVRMEFKTDALNTRSRQALLRIGAQEEGTLRQHMTTQSGRLRDSVYFSILDREWPEVRQALERRLPGAG
ncbi:MAG: GNAT family N-acetyltransferase [Gemmatimonadales bacterium]